MNDKFMFKFEKKEIGFFKGDWGLRLTQAGHRVFEKM